MSSGSDTEKEGKKDRMEQMEKFLKKNLTKGEMALKHAIGLGHKPNAVPEEPPVMDGPSRPVEIGWHPVGGIAGKWLAEETGLGKMITEKINEYPDPTQHWAILVGDFAHQLWMDENFHVIYTNERVNREEWSVFAVGQTTFNDDAIRRAGEAVIQDIRSRQPVYNLITNNCQTYVAELLDAIKVGMYKELGTTQAVYDKLTGRGKVKELFAQEPTQEEGGNTVSLAQQVMNTNTTKLDAKDEAKKKRGEKGSGKRADEKGGRTTGQRVERSIEKPVKTERGFGMGSPKGSDKGSEKGSEKGSGKDEKNGEKRRKSGLSFLTKAIPKRFR